MDRHLVAYLLLAAMVFAAVIIAIRMRYHSRDQVLKRSRHADQARRAERARLRSEEVASLD